MGVFETGDSVLVNIGPMKGRKGVVEGYEGSFAKVRFADDYKRIQRINTNVLKHYLSPYDKLTQAGFKEYEGIKYSGTREFSKEGFGTVIFDLTNTSCEFELDDNHEITIEDLLVITTYLEAIKNGDYY